MSDLPTPVFLAREYQDAQDLVEQLYEVRVEARICEVQVGEHQRGWQILVAAADAQRARSIATVLEVQRYGDWESRPGSESHWGVMEDEHTLGDPTEIYSAQSIVQAHLLKNLLAEQGITAIVTNQVLQGGSGIDFVGMQTAAKVVVPAEDAVAAREFALDFETRQHGPSASWTGEPSGPSAPWPTCPECGAKRTTRCPVCATSGTDFGEADRDFLGDLAAGEPGEPGGCCGSCCGASGHGSPEPCGASGPQGEEGSGPQGTLLVCPVCDEPFRPAYPRHCEWCGHEFDDGYVIEQIVKAEAIPGRAIALVLALGLFLLAGLAYFLFIAGS